MKKLSPEDAQEFRDRIEALQINAMLNDAWDVAIREGTIRAIFVVLEVRGIALSIAAKKEIKSCLTLDEADQILTRSVTATTEDDLFEEKDDGRDR